MKHLYCLLLALFLMLSMACSDNSHQLVLREAEAPSAEQSEIDSTRREMQERSGWGQQEEKSWQERYRGQSSATPYQGPSIQYQNQNNLRNKKESAN